MWSNVVHVLNIQLDRGSRHTVYIMKQMHFLLLGLDERENLTLLHANN